MSDGFSWEKWYRFRTVILAVWIGFIPAVGAMIMTSAGLGAGLLIFALVASSYLLNVGRPVFASASVVVVCLIVLYLANIWPGNDAITLLAAIFSRA